LAIYKRGGGVELGTTKKQLPNHSATLPPQVQLEPKSTNNNTKQKNGNLYLHSGGSRIFLGGGCTTRNGLTDCRIPAI